VLLIEFLILPHQQCPQTQSQETVEEHEGGTDRLALDVPWRVGRGEDAGAEQRAALADEVEDDDPHAPAGVGALVV